MAGRIIDVRLPSCAAFPWDGKRVRSSADGAHILVLVDGNDPEADDLALSAASEWCKGAVEYGPIGTLDGRKITGLDARGDAGDPLPVFAGAP